MTSNDNRTDPVAGGINTASNAVNAGQTAKSLASGLSAAQGKLLSGITEILFGGLSPQILGAIAGVILIVVVFAMIVSSVNPSTLFNSEATGIEYVVNALKEGFTYRKRSARKYIANFVENEYDCGGDRRDYSSRPLLRYMGMAERSERTKPLRLQKRRACRRPGEGGLLMPVLRKHRKPQHRG